MERQSERMKDGHYGQWEYGYARGLIGPRKGYASKWVLGGWSYETMQVGVVTSG